MADAQRQEAHTRDETFAAGTILFREGEVGGDLWIIRSGEVEVYRDRAGVDYVLARLGPGELLGVMTVTTGGRRAASVKAVSDLSVTIIQREQVERLLGGVPKWANTLINDLVSRVEHANELYIETAAADLHAQRLGPFDAALGFAATALELADLLVQDIGGRKVVPLDNLIHRTEVLQRMDQTRIERAVDALLSVGILDFRDAIAGQRAVTLGSVHHLRELVRVTEQVLAVSGAGEISLPFGAREQATLKAVAKLVGPSAQNLSTVASMPYRKVEEDVRRAGYKLHGYIVDEAARLELLVVDKKADDPMLTFSPVKLRVAMQSYEALKILLSEQVQKVRRDARKTLIY